jgi:PAS domain S-box-containing protein
LLELYGGEVDETNSQSTLNLVKSRYRGSERETVEETSDGRKVHFLNNAIGVIKDGHLFGIWGTQVDITAMKKMQDALKQSEERTRALLEAIPDMIFEFDREGVIHQFVPSSTLSPLLPPEEFVGKNINEVMPPDVVEQTMFAIRRALESGLLQVFEYQLPELDQHSYYEASVIRNDANSVIAMVRDVTARKWAVTERENLIDELEMKNAELEQFTYTVSHDLKSPLITITGFLGFLREDVETGNRERLEKDIQRINVATRKMQKLLGDLLELSRVGRLVNESKNVDMAEIVKEAIDLLHGQITQGNIQLQVGQDLPIVHVDRQRIVEVLQNLLDNSAKFMGDQTHPMIEIGTAGFEKEMPILYVHDNGMGIAPEFHERIFGLFNRLNPEVEGTGIGLALVKRIVEFHGGRIWVESEAGEGAAFYFTLPEAPRTE